jgi:drug/metabolite transporter (DMT)-like permease
MVVAMALWTGVEVLAGHTGRSFSPFQVVWTRYAAHIVVLLLVVGLRRGWPQLRTRRRGLQMVRSSMMLGMPAAFVFALRHQPASQVWAVFWLSPLVTMAVGWILLAEPAPPRHRWAAAGTGFLLMWAVLAPSVPRDPAGAVLSAVMGSCFVGYLTLTRVLRSESSESKLLYTALGVLLCLTPVMPLVWVTPTPRALAVMAAVGVVGLLGLWAVDRAIETLPISMAAPLAYAQGGWLLAALVVDTGRVRLPAIAAGCLAVLAAGYSARCEPPGGQLARSSR